MAFIKKKKYSIKKAAKIITDETGVEHTEEDIYEVANEGRLKICFKPQWGTSQHGMFCFVVPASEVERLKFKDKYFLAPKNRKANFLRNVFNKNMKEEVFPVLDHAGVYRLVNHFEKEFDVAGGLIKAVNNKGDTYEVVGCYEHPIPKKIGPGNKIFGDWIKEKEIPACKSDLGEDYNLYYYECLNQQDERQFLHSVNVDELFLTRFELEKYINIVNLEEHRRHTFQDSSNQTSFEPLDLDFYSLEKALEYFARNKPQLSTNEDIYQKAKEGILQLSLNIRAAGLIPIENKNKIDQILKITNKMEGDYKDEFEELRKLEHDESRKIVKNITLNIVEFTILRENRNEIIVNLVEYDGKSYIPKNIDTEGFRRGEIMYPDHKTNFFATSSENFYSSSILITKENLESFLNLKPESPSPPPEIPSDHTIDFSKTVNTKESLPPEPEVKKGNPPSFDTWMKWRIEDKERLSISHPMPYGFQASLIKECKSRFGYKDNSAVRDSWKRLKIKASTDRTTRIT